VEEVETRAHEVQLSELGTRACRVHEIRQVFAPKFSIAARSHLLSTCDSDTDTIGASREAVGFTLA
jgi:hypothetical protein